MSESAIRVCLVGPKQETVSFAGDELAACLKKATGREVVLSTAEGAPDSAALTVGLMDSVPGIAEPAVADARMDDAIHIDVTGEHGIIAGNNPRSVLLAVYRYLTELGFRWVRPGADGECVPRLDALKDIRVAETPSYRHRAVCIEGAVSYENVRDMVDWIPKLGFNGYFVQFREAHTFFDRWYAHQDNPELVTDTLPPEKAREYTAGIEGEIAKRGLLYHKVGHGWTCEPFGISGLGWHKETEEPAPEIAQYLAEVNGERKLWDGVALNTNLCYANPDVRRTIVEAIADYAREHPSIDLMHFWLADGSNNNCECAQCREARPSDFYVRMLNELDEELTRQGLPTKIVFLIYVDLLWPPEKETIRNPDRFVLMFAPIERTYSAAFHAGADLPELPPFVRNKLDFTSDVTANVAFLKAWQAQFDGDSFDFDYHLMWDHVNDPGHIAISKTIGEDMRALKDIGLDGYVSCQIQRVFLPTALPMTVMGRMLWDTVLAFDAIARDYFDSAFGADGEACFEYLAKLSELFEPPYLRGETKGTEAIAQKLGQVQGVIDAFLPMIERNLGSADPCHAKSWEYLRHHAELAAWLARAFKARADGDPETARTLWEDIKAMAWKKEPELQRVLDVWNYAGTIDRKFK
jgi:Domain of unknown function (DUF4838)